VIAPLTAPDANPESPISRLEALSTITAASGYCSSPEATGVAGRAGDYETMLHVALYVLGCLANGDSAPLRATLNAAETVLRTGDVPARELVEFGLLEELCNVNLWPPGVERRRILAAMGPRARQAKCVRDMAATLTPAGRSPLGSPGGVWWADVWLRGPLARLWQRGGERRTPDGARRREPGGPA
jgi:hypothetical protein